ncbi:hypothetical protein AYL99_05436 [Fonsecaea erecta]|uniref:Uncharacterized protein n=1 Tax=Fonsecaea erecta TaxID=1367422 RepID=A0A178ZKW1_9EURO|nr:hypothetical protein AYL99_05436 [Fonsecaea erecta]OAP60434.1 hypothetical protein AYL99_05436 [Fonsecaea erecta]
MSDKKPHNEVETPPKRPACPHTHCEDTNTIPVTIEAFRDIFKKAELDFVGLLWQLEHHGCLRVSSPESDKRIQGQLTVSVEEQVEAAINKIFHTSDWTGRQPLQDLITTFEHDYATKWGQPNGIWHDMARVYPECREEIVVHRDLSAL